MYRPSLMFNKSDNKHSFVLFRFQSMNLHIPVLDFSLRTIIVIYMPYITNKTISTMSVTTTINNVRLPEFC